MLYLSTLLPLSTVVGLVNTIYNIFMFLSFANMYTALLAVGAKAAQFLGRRRAKPPAPEIKTPKSRSDDLTHFVLYDGDNTPPTTFKKTFQRKPNTEHIWVHNVPHPPKVVKKENVRHVRPSNHGKEATDTHIAMTVVELIHTKRVGRLTIVTNDSDVLDIVTFAGKRYPDTKFNVVVDGSRSHRKPPRSELPKNTSVIVIR